MIRRYQQAIHSAQRRALIIGYALLGIAIFLLIRYLRSADLPWEKGVAARVAEEKTVKVIHHVITGMWYGCWINLVLCILLVIALPFLTQPLKPFLLVKAGVSKRSRPAFLLACVFALGIGVFLGVPRLQTSLWGDEEATIRRSVIGEYERNANDQPELKPVSWTDTFWGYKKPNNHILNSALTRLSHETLFTPSDAPGSLHFSEPILRLPAFLAALGALVAIGYALACFGFLRAGILSMFLLALHPWFLRYGTETRGYAFVFLFTALALVFLIKAVRRGRWQYWFAYSLCEFLMFWAYPGTFYQLIALNLSGLALVLSARGGWPNRRVQFSRFFLANVFSAMLVIQWMAPCYAQLKAYLLKSEGEDFRHFSWIFDNLSYILAGQPWTPWQASNPLCAALSESPLLGGSFLLLLGVALIAGAIRLYQASLQTRYLLGAMLLPWPLLISISMLKNDLLYQWYSVGSIIPAMMLIALGVEWLVQARFWSGLRRFSPLITLIFVAMFAAAAWPQVKILRAHSVEPLRESVQVTRSVMNPSNPEIDKVITVGFVQATRGYDPTMYFIRPSDPKGKFESLLERSTTEKKPLFVNLAMPEAARQPTAFPEIMKFIDDPNQFELVKRIHGMTGYTTRYVYRYVGGKL